VFAVVVAKTQVLVANNAAIQDTRAEIVSPDEVV
jgi:hypothetical protein